MQLPSDRYFEIVKTLDDYILFINTGMAWEVEPNCPKDWLEHQEMCKLRNPLKEEN